MKLLKALIGAVLFYCLVLSASSPLSSCTKTVNVHDTTVKVVHDTTIKVVRDTTIIIDTIYDCKTGLVAYYNFNGGNLNDSSGHHNNIFFNNAVAADDRNGIANNAYSFNGSSSYMQVANSSSLNPDQITISAIVKVNGFYVGLCSDNQILGKGYPDDISGFYSLRFLDTPNACIPTPDITKEFFAGTFGDNEPLGAASGTIAPTAVTTGTWYSLVFTYDGQFARIYINGVLKGITQKAVTSSSNNHDLFIGKHEDPTFPYYFNGIIDEIRIYNRALSGSAVQTLYTSVLN